MTYIPISGTAQDAADLSRAAYAASCPDGVIPAGSVTQYAFGWIVHPGTGAVALQVANVADVAGLIPASAIAGAMTFDQAQAAGWFAP